MSELRKSLGLPTLIALGVAGVVGSSWIYTSSVFFDSYGAGGMILGLIGGAVLAACIALAYGRLTATIPRAGGEVVWTYTALGRPFGFATGWLHIGAYIASLAFYVTAFGTVLAKAFPGLQTIPLWTINDEPVHLPVLALGIVLTAVIFGLNWRGVQLGGQVQVVLFAAMLAIGLALAVTGFATGTPDNLFPAWRADQDPLGSTVRMVVPGITYLAGFSLVAIMAEEARVAPRLIGRAVVITVVGAVAFYVVVLAATAWVSPWEQTAAGKLGTITAFTDAGFPALGWAALGIAVLGLLTSFIGLFVASTRIVLALARAELLPPALGRIDARSGVPRNACVFIAVVTVVLGLLGPGAITWFLDAGGVFLGLVWVLVVAAYLILPRRFPNLRRPASALGLLPVVGAIGALAVIGFALWPGTDLSLVWPAEHLTLLGWVVLGAVLFAITRPRRPAEELQRRLLGEHAGTVLGEGRPRDNPSSG